MTRVGVVGLGYWGPNLLRNLYELDAAEVVVACDQRPEALAQIVRRYPAVRVTTSFPNSLVGEMVETSG